MKYVVKLTEEEALTLGIVQCLCGHPPNNHFLRHEGKPCAHCNCKGLRPTFTMGKVITAELKGRK